MRNLIKKLLLVICLLTSPSLLSSEIEDRAVTEKYRVEYQDPVKLKSRLLNMLSTFEGFDGVKIERLKKRFDISDEIMRNVAVEMYHEAIIALSDKNPASTESVLNTYRGQVDIALFCLGLSADQDAKKLLMTIATNNETEMTYRRQAISSYLRASDAEEVKNVLLRFLVEEGRMDSQTRSSVCEYTGAVFQDASPEKKKAILESLYVALAREDNKWLFGVYDNILCKISKEYANSRERLAILKRLISAPSLCKADDYTMPELQEKLKVLQKTRPYTNINTNLAAIKARNFNLPLPAGATNELTAPVPVSREVEFTKVGDESNDPVSMKVVVSVLLLAVLGFSAWKFRKSKTQ